MKPDMEDYSDIEDVPAETRSRAMSWMVLAVAVGGFGALAFYAYHSGNKPAGEGEMLVVEADKAPIKEAPANPEGEQFPNKDKTIYDVIAPNGEQKTEKLLPDPEHPVAAANTEDSEDESAAPATAAAPATTTFVAGDETKKADPLDLALSKSGGLEKAPATTDVKEPAPAMPQAPVNVAEVPVATKAIPVPEKSYANPQIINEKPSAKKEEAKAEARPKAKTEPKPKAEKPAAKSGGTGVIQLGAFKSEAEAQASWKKISGKNADVLTGAPVIVKADVNGTTFYRLRTSVADAKATCTALSAKGQACMVAGK